MRDQREAEQLDDERADERAQDRRAAAGERRPPTATAAIASSSMYSPTRCGSEERLMATTIKPASPPGTR